MKTLKTAIYRAGFEALARTGLHRVAPLRGEGLGVLLTLHHVRPKAGGAYAPNRELEITPEFLDAALGSMQAAGYEFVSLDDVSRRLDAGERGRRFAAVTLDDGYRDNLEVALPIFRRHGVPFTVFCTTGFLRRDAMIWWKVVEEVVAAARSVEFDFGGGTTRFRTELPAEKEAAAHTISAWARTARPADVLLHVGELARRHGFDPLEPTRRDILSIDELRVVAADPLATIGAHTRTHANIRQLDEAEAVVEMDGGAEELAEMLGQRPRHFCFPYGSATAAGPRDFDLARKLGFELACTTRPGMLQPAHAEHRTALPRVSLNGNFQDLRYLEVLLSGLPILLANGFRRLDVA